MKVFKNDINQIRSGWKIGILYLSFIITTLIVSFIFTMVYSGIIIAKNPEILSDQTKYTNYIQEQFSGMSNFPAVFLQLIQCICMILFVVLFWKIWDKGKLKILDLLI